MRIFSTDRSFDQPTRALRERERERGEKKGLLRAATPLISLGSLHRIYETDAAARDSRGLVQQQQQQQQQQQLELQQHGLVALLWQRCHRC